MIHEHHRIIRMTNQIFSINLSFIQLKVTRRMNENENEKKNGGQFFSFLRRMKWAFHRIKIYTNFKEVDVSAIVNIRVAPALPLSFLHRCVWNKLIQLNLFQSN